MQPFTKFQGLGNDFVIVDRRASGVDVTADEARRWCDRHFGVGADGVLALLPDEHTDARMVVHNADGSIAQMCGNGLRCVAAFLGERRGGQPDRLRIATGAGPLLCELSWRGAQVEAVTISMGPAMLESPVLPGGGPHVKEPIEGYLGTAVSMGNPHFVLLESAPSEASRLGPLLERHPAFPERTNVEFVEPRPQGGLKVIVWERGVGLTLACGTGACAAVAAFGLEGRVPFDAWVPVELPGGALEVKVTKTLDQVFLRGPARAVFEGELP